ncbi:MAG: hypothetical protein GDA51_03970 [Ekhidna sp.]|nr:hypothetical protein [Ekhidna sp.]
MNRVYITRNAQGQGAEPVDAGETFGVNDKGDGSIDLSEIRERVSVLNYHSPLPD